MCLLTSSVCLLVKNKFSVHTVTHQDALRGRIGALSYVSPQANLSVVESSVQQEMEIQFGVYYNHFISTTMYSVPTFNSAFSLGPYTSCACL